MQIHNTQYKSYMHTFIVVNSKGLSRNSAKIICFHSRYRVILTLRVQNLGGNNLLESDYCCISKMDDNEVERVQVRHEWYQSVQHVTVTFFAKECDKEKSSAIVCDGRLNLELYMPQNRVYLGTFDLFGEVNPDTTNVFFGRAKVEVKLEKSAGAGYNWPVLVKSDAHIRPIVVPEPAKLSAPVQASAPAPAPIETEVPASSYRNSKKKDWSEIEKELEADDEEAAGGEEALQKLFRQIYANADPDTRRAMVKSFQTSGGTVLSTNWNEVSQRNYEEEKIAPKGMEAKKWT